MTRKVNAATLAHIKASEGLRLSAYPDPGSKNGEPWTIGYGSTSGVRKGMTITKEQAEARLVQDLTHAEDTVSRLVMVPLNDNQFGALVSFVFNIGSGAFASSTLLRKLNAGDYSSVPAQLARWNRNDGSVMAGLTKRRAAEAKLWATPAPFPIDLPDEPQTPASEPRKSPVAAIIAVLVAIGAAVYAFLKAKGIVP